MPTDESPDFSIEPRTQAEYTRANWAKIGDVERLIREEIIPRLDTTNGRVTSLERWRYGIAGGLAVIVAVAVPLFVYFATHASLMH